MKGPDDRFYKCTNRRIAHIKHTRIDMYGRTRPVFQATCKYHLKTCYNDHGNRFVAVAVANKQGERHLRLVSWLQLSALTPCWWWSGLCNECHVRATDRPPLGLDPLAVPGVVKEPRRKIVVEQEKPDDAGTDDEGPGSSRGAEHLVCRWQPDHHKEDELKYVCKNRAFRNPNSRKYERFCVYHLPQCWQEVSQSFGLAAGKQPNN